MHKVKKKTVYCKCASFSCADAVWQLPGQSRCPGFTTMQSYFKCSNSVRAVEKDTTIIIIP